MDDTKRVIIPKGSRTQRVEIYLQDLKHRLKEMRKQQEEVVKNSLDIIKEIDRVSSKLIWDQDNNVVTDDHISKIQNLIEDFEATRTDKYNCEPIIENIKKGSALKESLVSFCKANESLEKIDTFVEASDNIKQKNVKTKNLRVSDKIRDKINKLSINQKRHEIPTTSKKVANTLKNINFVMQTDKQLSKKNQEQDGCSYYGSCCSSMVSIQRFKTLNSDLALSECTTSFTGYDGDNDDSECEFKITDN